MQFDFAGDNTYLSLILKQGIKELHPQSETFSSEVRTDLWRTLRGSPTG